MRTKIAALVFAALSLAAIPTLALAGGCPCGPDCPCKDCPCNH